MTVPLFALLLPGGLIVYFLQASISYQTLIGGGSGGWRRFLQPSEVQSHDGKGRR